MKKAIIIVLIVLAIVIILTVTFFGCNTQKTDWDIVPAEASLSEVIQIAFDENYRHTELGIYSEKDYSALVEYIRNYLIEHPEVIDGKNAYIPIDSDGHLQVRIDFANAQAFAIDIKKDESHTPLIANIDSFEANCAVNCNGKLKNLDDSSIDKGWAIFMGKTISIDSSGKCSLWYLGEEHALGFFKGQPLATISVFQGEDCLVYTDGKTIDFFQLPVYAIYGCKNGVAEVRLQDQNGVTTDATIIWDESTRKITQFIPKYSADSSLIEAKPVVTPSLSH